MVGSAIVIAISTSILNSYIRPELSTLLGISSNDSLLALGQSLASLSDEVQTEVRHILAEGYNRQMLVLCASAAAQIPSGLLLWRKEQIMI